jgi:hypothetical protein
LNIEINSLKDENLKLKHLLNEKIKTIDNISEILDKKSIEIIKLNEIIKE